MRPPASDRSPAVARLLVADPIWCRRTGSNLAADELVLLVRPDAVAAGAAVDDVALFVPGLDQILAGAAEERVLAGAAVEDVVAVAAVRLVVTLAELETVVAVAVAALELLVRRLLLDDRITEVPERLTRSAETLRVLE